jgi:hypothetical protein
MVLDQSDSNLTPWDQKRKLTGVEPKPFIDKPEEAPSTFLTLINGEFKVG